MLRRASRENAEVLLTMTNTRPVHPATIKSDYVIALEASWRDKPGRFDSAVFYEQ